MGVVRGFILILSLSLTTLAAAQDPPVQIIRFNPLTGFAPLFVRFTVAIEPHIDNKSWCYGFFEPGMERPTIEHCEELWGDKNAKYITKEEKTVDGGEYAVVAFVYRRGLANPLRSSPITLKVNEGFPQ